MLESGNMSQLRANRNLFKTVQASERGNAWMNTSMTTDSEAAGLHTTRFMNDIINKSIDIQ